MKLKETDIIYQKQQIVIVTNILEQIFFKPAILTFVSTIRNFFYQ